MAPKLLGHEMAGSPPDSSSNITGYKPAAYCCCYWQFDAFSYPMITLVLRLSLLITHSAKAAIAGEQKNSVTAARI